MGEVKEIIIGLLVLSALLVGSATFYGDLFQNYGYDNITDVSYISAATETQGLVTNLKTSIEDTQITGIALIDVSLAIASGTYNSLIIMLSAIGIIESLISDIAYIVGVPSWVINLVIGIFTIIIMFAIIKGVTKVEV